MMFKVGSMEDPCEKIWDYKGKSEIVQIFISHSCDKVDFIQFLYVEDGTLVMSEKLGGSAGKLFNVVNFDYPSEFITGISGATSIRYKESYGFYKDCCYISSVTIGTNKRTYGPFGRASEEHDFNIQMGEHSPFGGFHGSTSTNGDIESIGVYVKPIASLSNLNNPQNIKKEEIEL